MDKQAVDIVIAGLIGGVRSLPKISEKKNQRVPRAGVVGRKADTRIKQGRNDECQCGSGKKAKHCCKQCSGT